MTSSTLAEIHVIDCAERGDRTKQAKQHVKAALHAQCFQHADRACNQQADDGESQRGARAGITLGRLAPILCLCLCGHKMRGALSAAYDPSSATDAWLGVICMSLKYQLESCGLGAPHEVPSEFW